MNIETIPPSVASYLQTAPKRDEGETMIELSVKAEEMLTEAVAKEGPNPSVRIYQAGIG